MRLETRTVNSALYLQYFPLPPVLEVEEEPLSQPVMSEVTSALADANHSLDHVDTLRHLGGLPQPGLGQVQSHAGEGESFCHELSG